MKPLRFGGKQCVDVDCLDFGKDIVRFFPSDHLQNRLFVLHINHMMTIGYQVCRCVFVGIHGDDFYTHPLCFDRHLFTQFTASQ